MSTATLEAGRELDALVAERVMGWVRNLGSYAGTTQWNPGAVMVLPPTHRFTPNPTDEPVTYFDNLPRYSSDIAAAWQVVEKMKDHPRVNRRALQLVAWEYGRTYAAFSNESPDFGLVTWSEGSGPHATPLAICRAALAAVEAL